MTLRPFHLAIPVDNIKAAKEFYGSKLGFVEGRSDDHWVDFNFFGHQLVCHIGESNSFSNEVDGRIGGSLRWDGGSVFAAAAEGGLDVRPACGGVFGGCGGFGRPPRPPPHRLPSHLRVSFAAPA